MISHLNRLIKTVQMRDHYIYFYAALTKIIFNNHQILSQFCSLMETMNIHSVAIYEFPKYLQSIIHLFQNKFPLKQRIMQSFLNFLYVKLSFSSECNQKSNYTNLYFSASSHYSCYFRIVSYLPSLLPL